MRYEDKRGRIAGVCEADLRRMVLIPLLKAMGFTDVYERHGATEMGKDILFREASRLGDAFYYAAVVTTKDITGRIGDSDCALRILDQVRMALNESFYDKYSGRRLTIDRCWVVTSGTVKPTAIDSIAGELQHSGLGRLVRFVDVERLVELVDAHYPQLWHRPMERVFVGTGEWVDISTNRLDPPWDKEVDDLPMAGSLGETVYRAKQVIRSLLIDMDFEFVKKLHAILRSNDPWEIYGIWETMEDELRDGRIEFGLSSQIVQLRGEMGYLWQDMVAYKDRLQLD